jgi:8-amino-7-oxononanoate synthase
MTKLRNTSFVVEESHRNYQTAVESHLMQVTIKGRDGKVVEMPTGQQVVEFINCSYLGLDLHPDVVAASKELDPSWGVNFCCARSRFSIEPMRVLEEELSRLYRGRAITFPSVTTTHMSVMPLLASGVLINPHLPPRVHFIFDRFAHSSMQYLRPILAAEATVESIGHNALDELRQRVLVAKAEGKMPIFVADGIYSMGGLCPVNELLKMADELDFYLYMDDAHGTTILGDRGEGSVLAQIRGELPDRLFVAFCLSKGFGSNGGGILVSNAVRERTIRSFGQIYAFSAALDFSIVNACLATLKLHYDGTVQQLQQQLRDRVALYDRLMHETHSFSPIRMVMIGGEQEAIEAARGMIDQGFFVSVVFFPIVPRNKAQLRICISASHTEEQIRGLVAALDKVTKRSSAAVASMVAADLDQQAKDTGKGQAYALRHLS